jgi:GTP-binding protein
VILAANKAEGKAGEGGWLEAFSLGLGEPIRLSGEHGEGMEDLLSALMPIAEEFEARDERTAEEAPQTDVDLGWTGEETEDDADEPAEDWRPSERRPLQIAVVGRPNAGKSTLINRILGEERLLTGPEAGITRDAISIPLAWEGTPVRIFDTAGMRKRAKVQDKLEKLSVSDGLRAVRFAEVVVVLLDVDTPFEQQDLRIADLAEREGRAVVIAVNKWDLATDREARLQHLKDAFERLLPQLRGAPLVTVSAKTGRGLDRLHAAVLRAHELWNRRISTAQLNRWLLGMTEAHPPPAPGGRRIKMRYMTQVKTRPPAFVIMSSHPEEVPASYERYLVNGLREAFDLPGTPIRMMLRDTGAKNPYKGRKKANVTSLSKHLGKADRT